MVSLTDKRPKIICQNNHKGCVLMYDVYILQSLSETQTMNKCARVRKNSQKQLLNPSGFCATCKIVDRAGPGVALI